MLLSAVVVNTTVDSIYPPFTGIVSLRNAIQTANSSSSPTTITFDPKVFSSPQKIVLIQGTLTLNNAAGASTTVIGPPAGVTIDGDAQGDVLDLRQGAVTLSGIMVTNAKGAGIAVYSAASLNLSNAVISGNDSTGTNTDAGGIGCYSSEVTATDVTVSGNVAAGAGGGIENDNGTLVLGDCTISGNNSAAEGGGIYCQSGATTLSNCTVYGNTVTSSGPGSMGGGIWAGGNLTLTNCTIVGNSASAVGGVASPGQFTATIDNSIIARNQLKGAAVSAADVSGSFNSLGYNLIGETDGSTGWNAYDLTGTASKPLDPKLSPLGNYGGPTQSMALLPGSPALNAGWNALAVDANDNSLTTDQRGLPRVYGSSVDIGAYESQPPALAGDVNHDGTVNLSDLLLLTRDFGKTTPMYEGGDLDRDGSVGLSDFLILVRNFGKSATSAATAVAFPTRAQPQPTVPRAVSRRTPLGKELFARA
ncbi:MAG TPA: choice-of-anchor Q domain-containing protein, partial [Tepidisphaeraceae bacterium]|nr:choice-of-anchor Q domain-containing protein [Tepidisphaeraceae bacterium]